MSVRPIVFAAVGWLVAASAVFSSFYFFKENRAASARAEQYAKFLSEKEETYEVLRGVYQKASQENVDLKSLVLEGDERARSLFKMIEKKHEDVLSANVLVLKWKKAYKAEVEGRQSEQPPSVPGGPARKRVDFSRDFDHFRVVGHTLTDPPQATLDVSQTVPWRLSVVVSRNQEGRWMARTTAPDGLTVDIETSQVDPDLLSPRWYQNIGITATGAGGADVLGGLGISYNLGAFELGGSVFVTPGQSGVERYYGGQVTWRPFR